MSIHFLGFACALLAAEPPADKPKAKSADQELVDAGRAVIGSNQKTLIESLALATKEIKGAIPVEIKAENPRSEKLFGVYLLKGEALHEVEIDVVSAKVVRSKEKSISEEHLSHFKSMASRCKLSFARAVESAQERCKKGKPIRIRLEEKGTGKDAVVQVGVYLLDGDKLVEIELNGEHGEVLAVKERTIR